MQAPFDIAADLDTPVSAFLKLGPLKPRFLLESVEGFLLAPREVLFDGDPGSPDLGALWDLAATSGTTSASPSSAVRGAAGWLPRAQLDGESGHQLDGPLR